jgi:formylglycine-generating enzyme required for sulfatase activity
MSSGDGGPSPSLVENRAVSTARLLLQLDPTNRPRCRDARAIVAAVDGLVHAGNQDAIDELLTGGFLRHSVERYRELIEPQMQAVEGARFRMGTDESRVRHFCGESPRHAVVLSPFRMQRVTVTCELFGVLDERRPVRVADLGKPVVGVTWFEAAVFALWVGCRLPTEAEWELACGADQDGEWCCVDESQLTRFAWYSENSGGMVHHVATREPNLLGLFDLHGNVWEWCADVHDQDYYRRSPSRDPLNAVHDGDGELDAAHRVCRGGSAIGFAEMCRTRYRFHEPPALSAADLGFRLVRGGGSGSEGGYCPW